jgi:hypothetical protein
MSSMIGIKIADGSFFPILEEDKAAKKRLVLTTAHDVQTNVQIDVYKSSSMSMNDASYIGTLLVENILQKKKGDPSIELVISYDANGELSATAYDIDQPDEKNKALLIVSMPPDEPNLADFVFETESAPDGKFAANVKRPNTVRLAIAAAVILAFAGAALWFFFLRTKPPQAEPSTQSRTEAPSAAPVPAAAVPQPPVPPATAVIQPPAVTGVPPEAAGVSPASAQVPPPVAVKPPVAPVLHPDAPVYSVTPPGAIPAGGVKYRLRWGDTLWDISQVFYGTPRYYRHIARYNGYRNPNRVVSGRTITIPPLPR